MVDPTSRMNPEVLAGALRDVVGEDAEQALREGPLSAARLVRKLLASPLQARKLVDAVTAREIERRTEDAPPLAYGPVATDRGTYDDPALMLDPMGSPEFEAAMDSLTHSHEGSPASLAEEFRPEFSPSAGARLSRRNGIARRPQ